MPLTEVEDAFDESYEKALEEAGGDLPEIVIPQPDGSEVRMSARQALDEARADATAHDEFLNCIGTTLEGAT